MNWMTEAREAHQGIGKPTEVDSMNRLRVQAEDKAARYRRALLLACDGDVDKVAFYVSEAAATPPSQTIHSADTQGLAAADAVQRLVAAARAVLAHRYQMGAVTLPIHNELEMAVAGIQGDGDKLQQGSGNGE